MIHGKRGIELSITFLVTIIISLILLSFGMIFARNFFGSSESLVHMQQEDIDRQIQGLSCSGAEIVCLDLASKELERGKQHVFGVRVVNALKDPHIFEIQVQPVLYIDKEGKRTSYQDGLVTLFEGEPLLLDSKRGQTVGILIRAKDDARKGEYIVDIYINYDADKNGMMATEQYDRPHSIHVTVV